MNSTQTHLFNRVSDRQQTVVLQECSFLIAKRFGDIFALFFCQHYAVEAFVNDMIVVEGTRILRKAINLPAERAPRPPVDRMAVSGADDVWTSGVDRGVNHVGCCVKQTVLSTVNDFAGVVDQLEWSETLSAICDT